MRGDALHDELAFQEHWPVRALIADSDRNGAADGNDQSHRHNTAWTACHRAVQAVAFFYCMWLNNGAQPFAALLGLYP